MADCRLMMSKHTAGPWKVIADPCHFDSLSTVIGGDNSRKKGVDGEFVVQVGGWANWQTQEANARLIAAAPDLLEALEECIFALEPYDDVKPRDWVTDRERLRRAHQAARAAITKATGGE